MGTLTTRTGALLTIGLLAACSPDNKKAADPAPNNLAENTATLPVKALDRRQLWISSQSTSNLDPALNRLPARLDAVKSIPDLKNINFDTPCTPETLQMMMESIDGISRQTHIYGKLLTEWYIKNQNKVSHQHELVANAYAITKAFFDDASAFESIKKISGRDPVCVEMNVVLFCAIAISRNTMPETKDCELRMTVGIYAGAERPNGEGHFWLIIKDQNGERDICASTSASNTQPRYLTPMQDAIRGASRLFHIKAQGYQASDKLSVHFVPRE